MGRKLVVKELKRKFGVRFTILETMFMKKIMTDGHEVYAIQKGNVTFMAWKRKDGSIITKQYS